MEALEREFGIQAAEDYKATVSRGLESQAAIDEAISNQVARSQ